MKDAIELAKGLKEKEFSFQELAADVQKKIKKQNHELNAFVALEPFENSSTERLIPFKNARSRKKGMASYFRISFI